MLDAFSGVPSFSFIVLVAAENENDYENQKDWIYHAANDAVGT